MSDLNLEYSTKGGVKKKGRLYVMDVFNNIFARKDDKKNSENTDLVDKKLTVTEGSMTEEVIDKFKTALIKSKTNYEKRYLLVDNKISDENLRDYDKHRTLGMGSFGRVLLVRNSIRNEYYAMKILEKEKLKSKHQISHTLNEKRILFACRSDFIVKLHNSFKDNSYIYFILELVEGGEMFKHLRRSITFSEAQAKFYAAQITLAFEYLHNLKIAHRDLKPENVLICPDGYVKLTDFGFAKLINSRTWTFCGTPEYLAPEIIQHLGYNFSPDWWTLGVLIYEMCYGQPPFTHHDMSHIYKQILTGNFVIPSTFSNDLASLVKNLLQTDMLKRYGMLKAGILDIKTHRWFVNVDWWGMYEKSVTPIFVPKVKGKTDFTNFDDFQEEMLHVALIDKYANDFKDF